MLKLVVFACRVRLLHHWYFPTYFSFQRFYQSCYVFCKNLLYWLNTKNIVRYLRKEIFQKLKRMKAFKQALNKIVLISHFFHQLWFLLFTSFALVPSHIPDIFSVVEIWDLYILIESCNVGYLSRWDFSILIL